MPTSEQLLLIEKHLKYLRYLLPKTEIQPFNQFIMKSGLYNNVKKILFKAILLSIFICSIQLKAQHNIYQLTDDKDLLVNQLKNDAIDADRFIHLLEDLNATIYIANNRITNTKGKEPVELVLSDVQSFNLLKTYNAEFNKVELLRINIPNKEDLNTPLDLEQLNGFNNLKYIYITAPFNLNIKQVKDFIINTPPHVIIIFKISNLA